MFPRFPKMCDVHISEAMNNVSEQEPVCSNVIYRKMRDVMDEMVEDLSSYILDKITSNLDLDDSFSVAAFFRAADIEADSAKYNVFYSSYRPEIIRMVEKNLYAQGYNSNVVLEENNNNRPIKFKYTTKVINRRRMYVFGTMFLLTSIPMMMKVSAMVSMYMKEKEFY